MPVHRYFLRGDIDIASAPKVRSDVLELAHQVGVDDLLIDCSHLTFIDSSGVAVLLEARHELDAVGRQMRIVDMPDQCRRVFEVLRLTDLFNSDRDDLRPR